MNERKNSYSNYLPFFTQSKIHRGQKDSELFLISENRKNVQNLSSKLYKTLFLLLGFFILFVLFAIFLKLSSIYNFF